MTKGRLNPSGCEARLRILATTDLHMHLTSFDYYARRPDPGVGLTRTASLIAAAREEAASHGALTLLFDNGDALQGNPLSDAARRAQEQTHPLMRAFSHLRYDAIGLGNHDFDRGLAALGTVLRQAPCPVICSNLRLRAAEDTIDFAPFAILERQVRCGGAELPLRIGVLAFLPPQTPTWAAHLLQGRVAVDGIVESARRRLPELADAGCDLVVALAHSGLASGPQRPDMENAAVPLAALDGIDAVIAGHTHQRFPGPDLGGLRHADARAGLVHGKPAVMAGAWGSHLGVIDLRLRHRKDGRWHVSEAQSALRPIARRLRTGEVAARVPEAPGLVRLLASDHARALEVMEQPVGHSDVALHSYFTFFAHDRSLALVAAAQAAAIRPHLAGTPAEGLPLLSAAAPGRFGARAGPANYTDIPPGPLKRRHLADLYVYPNELQAVVVTGAQIVDWLEMSARLFSRIPEGSQERDLLDPAVPGHEFDILHGLSYQIDPSREARFGRDGSPRANTAFRTSAVRFQNRPVEPAQRFVVALNSYRAGGGGNFAFLRDVPALTLPRIAVRDALRDYLSGVLPIDPLQTAPAPWRLVAMPGTSVRVRTGPGAARHLSELAGRGIETRGRDRHGFLCLSVPL